MAVNYYDSFIRKLQEIFMMDHAELDFGNSLPKGVVLTDEVRKHNF